MRFFSTDHKVIGLQYAFTSLAFLLILLVHWLCGIAHHRMRATILVESEPGIREFLATESAAQRVP